VQVRVSGGELEVNMGRLSGRARLQIGQPLLRSQHPLGLSHASRGDARIEEWTIARFLQKNEHPLDTEELS